MGQWSDVVAPLVAKCEVAAKIGKAVTWPSEGADALGKLIKEMAEKLDAVIAEKRGYKSTVEK